MKVHLNFIEEVWYDVDLVIDDDVIAQACAYVGLDQVTASHSEKEAAVLDFFEHSGGKYENPWFDLLEEQHPRWVNGIGVRVQVAERHLESIAVHGPVDQTGICPLRETDLK